MTQPWLKHYSTPDSNVRTHEISVAEPVRFLPASFLNFFLPFPATALTPAPIKKGGFQTILTDFLTTPHPHSFIFKDLVFNLPLKFNVQAKEENSVQNFSFSSKVAPEPV